MRRFPENACRWIFPAIDLRRGRCVRLVRGARDAEIHYDDDPVKIARQWVDQGGECLHVIDLGSALGESDSVEAVLAITAAVDVPIQVGGGVRDEARLQRLLDGGVARVIVSTRAFRDPPFLRRAVEEHGPERIVVAMDCEGESLRIGGWEEASPLSIGEALKRVEGADVRHLLVTATDRDGTFAGPRRDLVERVLEEYPGHVVAAGGIGSVEHIRSMLEIRHPRLEGVVVGRALYEGKVDLAEALQCASESRNRTERESPS